MKEELYKKLSDKELVRCYPCNEEEYSSIPRYLKSHYDEQSNMYYRYKEMDEYQLIMIALQLEQIELDENILIETRNTSSSLRFGSIPKFV